MSITCANCQAELPEDAKYCSDCGQSTKSTRLPFFPFIRDSFHELLDIDGRLSLTLKTLLSKPGHAAYEFEQGKRNKYTPPLRLYLVISVIFFLIFANFQHVYTGAEQHSESATTLYSRAMFVLFPMFALYLKAFYWNSYYLPNLVFSMHIHSVGYLVLMIISPLEALEDKGIVFLLLQVPPSLYFLWYFVQSFKTMFQESWPITIIKTTGVYVVYMGTLGLVFDVVLS